MRKAAKKNMVVIYGVMYTEHGEYTLLKIFKGTLRILPLITIQMHTWSDS